MIVALKLIDKEILRKTNTEKQILREIKIQSYLQHPNILKILGFFDYPQENTFVIILEYCSGGNLYAKLKNSRFGYLDEEIASYYIEQICNALRYMQKYKILHRDIKPENIMIHFVKIFKYYPLLLN